MLITCPLNDWTSADRLLFVNQLFYGDNLDVLQRHIKDESVDLVYLDPPFKSNQDYNVLFAEKDGTRAAAQIKAFEDTWQWDQEAARAYHEIVETGPERLEGYARPSGRFSARAT